MKKSTRTSRRYPKGKLYCMDCRLELEPELARETKRMMKELEMPNMLIFAINGVTNSRIGYVG